MECSRSPGALAALAARSEGVVVALETLVADVEQVSARRRGRRDLRLTEVSGVVHDVPLHGFVIGGRTRRRRCRTGKSVLKITNKQMAALNAEIA